MIQPNYLKESYTAEDLKELYPTIFAEKEAISSVYTENYKAQKVIENSVAKLDELIVYQSTLNKVEDKMSLKLIFIISNVLGIFLGVFIVFVKEFLKGINWKELKQLSKQGVNMNNYQVTNVENEERNFIDLVKLLIKNRMFILKVTIASLVLGIVFYVIYDKTKPLNMEQKFYLTYIDRMEEMEIAGVPVAPELAFKDNKFIDMFFEKEFIKKNFKGTSDKEKRGFIQSKLAIKMEKIRTDRFLYTLITKGKTQEENKEWASTYFELLNKYTEEQNRAKLDKEYLKLEKKSGEYRNKLQSLEQEIRSLVILEKKEMTVGAFSLASEIREKNPRVFSEKDGYSEIYNGIIEQKEKLSQFLDFLDTNIEFRSSLIESEGKVNLIISAIVSITFGFLISIIYILAKNYFKEINWD